MSTTTVRLAGIQYVGLAGISQDCEDAVIRLVQYGSRITLARILTHAGHHSLLLSVDSGDLVAVKSGFGSGYSGTGAHAFSFVLALLYGQGTHIEEYEVEESVLERLDMSALTNVDIARLEKARPISPTRWSGYLLQDDLRAIDAGTLRRRFKPIMPFAIVDARIMDLAMRFAEAPDDCLIKGYRRLEDCLRERTGLEDHGSRLMSQVFSTEPPRLTWRNIDKAEHHGRAGLFTAVFAAYRNPRAHREPREYSEELAEFLLLNQLFVLEDEAVDRRGRKRRTKNKWQVLLDEARPIDSRSKWRRARKKAKPRTKKERKAPPPTS